MLNSQIWTAKNGNDKYNKKNIAIVEEQRKVNYFQLYLIVSSCLASKTDFALLVPWLFAKSTTTCDHFKQCHSMQYKYAHTHTRVCTELRSEISDELKIFFDWNKNRFIERAQNPLMDFSISVPKRLINALE